jgi:formate dehydrogenase alpha subunit
MRSRRSVLELLLSTYYETNPSIDEDGGNELFRWAKAYGIPIAPKLSEGPRYPFDSDPNPFIHVDLNKCILCTRCVRACAEVQGRFVLGVENRGYNSRITAGRGENFLDAGCESCGACVAYCPTGALASKLSLNSGSPERSVATTCAYCGVGCQVTLNVRGERILSASGSASAPVNGRRLCVKGRYGYDFVHHPDRLSRPLVRRYLLEGRTRIAGESRGEWVPVDWDTALDLAARNLHAIRSQSGPDSIGVLSSAKCTNEENYLMNKFARQVIGTNNIDHCARLCHSSTVTGLAIAYGSGAMSNSMDDVAEKAGLILVTGSNTTEQHPVFGTMLRQAVLKRGAKLIVVDPRRIDLANIATLHLQLKGGTDIALFNGLMHLVLKNNWQDEEFIRERTEGFEDFAANLEAYTPEYVSEITRVPVAQLHEAARLLGTVKPGALIWAMGITQHIVGVQNVLTMANLQMLLGNIGIPGGGVNPLRGQNNVQGACDMGALPNVYPDYQNVTREDARLKFEQAWGTALSPKTGLTVTEMIPAACEGRLRAMYVMGEDPVMSDPDSNHARECLGNLDLLVLQDIFPTETSAYADILLPAASFAEKDGTFTNTERRVQLVNQAIAPHAGSRQDWQITSELAKRMLVLAERALDADAPCAGWEYSSPSAVMDEAASLAPNYAGISHARLRAGERLQWPARSKDGPGTPILHTRQFTRGKGLFSVTNHLPPAERPDTQYPMLLNTGRVLYHWHGGEMTRRAKGLLEVYPRSLVEINPEDATALGIENDGDEVVVSSRRGQMRAYAWVTERVAPGAVFANFHFPESPANALTIAALDPQAKIPEFKVCAVRLEKAGA